MLDDMYEVEESELPSLTDPKMVTYGMELGREFEAFWKPRSTLETEIWPSCIRAYMAIRDDMPFIPSMKFIDNGMLGDAGIRTAVKQYRDELMSATVPTDDSWLEPASLNDDDDDGDLELIKNLLITKFKEARMRDTTLMTFDQLLSIGTTAVGIRWDQRYAIRRANRDMVKGLKSMGDALELTDDSGKPLSKKRQVVKYAKKIFDGPLTYPINMYRLWLDPTASQNDGPIGFIYLVMKTKQDLEGARDPVTREPLYDQTVLENVKEWTYAEYYSQHPYEAEALQLMGINPKIENAGKIIPVYIFYRQVRKFEDDEVFVDRFFYCARSGAEWKIIRVQDNPSTFGVQPFYVMACDPWNGTPYGSGLVEKALSAWRAQNIIDAISLNAKVLQLFPPTYYFGGVLKDDRKPKYMPGSHQEIVNRPGIGLEWIQPYPIEAQNVLVGMQEQRYYSEKILSATGVSSAGLLTDPTKSVTKEKTATEVRQASAEGVQSAQTLVDRINDNLLEPMANAMHDLLRQHIVDNKGQKFVTTDASGKPVTQTVTPDVMDRDRQIKVLGRKALADKANTVENMLEVMKILANPQAAQVVTHLPLILQDVIFKAISRLGVPIKPDYKKTPEQIFTEEPQVQVAAIQQALQNPQIRQQLGEALLQSPEGQQFIAAMRQQFAQEAQGQQQPQQPPQQGAAA